MSGFIAIASSKEIELPEEIALYNEQRNFDIPNKAFSLTKLDEWEEEGIRQVFSMPFIYDVGGIGSEHFWLYLEKYMEVGDVLEIASVPDQLHVYEHAQKIIARNERITINVGSFTYGNEYGCVQLNTKNWLEELKYRTLYTDRGVTTIVKY